ncbi:MAG TPA: 50S ribosomal protein L29 [Elainellaceae cyanobacterium]
MSLSKIESIRGFSDEEILEEIVAVKKQLFDLRFQKATRQLEQTHQFKHARHRLAQLMTVERERQMEAVSEPKSDSARSSEIPSPESDISEKE